MGPMNPSWTPLHLCSTPIPSLVCGVPASSIGQGSRLSIPLAVQLGLQNELKVCLPPEKKKGSPHGLPASCFRVLSLWDLVQS